MFIRSGTYLVDISLNRGQTTIVTGERDQTVTPNFGERVQVCWQGSPRNAKKSQTRENLFTVKKTVIGTLLRTFIYLSNLFLSVRPSPLILSHGTNHPPLYLKIEYNTQRMKLWTVTLTRTWGRRTVDGGLTSGTVLSPLFGLKYPW